MAYTREEIEAEGLHDFRVFLVHVWKHLGLPKPTPLQLDIAFWLQHGPDRLMVQAFRGVGKSFITAAFALWTLFMNPQAKVMIVSAGEGLANDISVFMRQIVETMPLLQHLRPNPGQADSNEKWTVGPARPDKSPSIKSVGLTGQITGSRAHLIIADDLETPKTSYTHLLRERQAELIKEFDAVILPGKGHRIIYLGTPQVEDSLYRRLPGRGYALKVWPSEIPSKTAMYGGTLAEYVEKRIEAGYPAGTPLEPSRFPRHDLDSRAQSYGLSGYALQFLLDTSPASIDRHPLKLADLLVMDMDAEMAPVKVVWGREREACIQDLPSGGFDGDVYYRPVFRSDEMGKYGGTVLAIDPSGQGKDETAYAIVKFNHGMLYLCDVGGFTDGFGEATLKALAGAAFRWQVSDVIAEANYGGGMFDQLLRPWLAKVGRGRFDEEWKGWSTGMKEMRILDILEPVIQSHRLVVNRKVIEDDNLLRSSGDSRYSFVYQFTRMQRLKGALANEDRLEAVAMACSYFTSKMDRDKDRALEAHKLEAFKKMKKSILNNPLVLGAPRTYYRYRKA